jgi:tetratricopeptide (TPR) repeat protein
MEIERAGLEEAELAGEEAEPIVEAPEDLKTLLEAAELADSPAATDAGEACYAISDPEPLDVALRHAVEEVLREDSVAETPRDDESAALAPEAPAPEDEAAAGPTEPEATSDPQPPATEERAAADVAPAADLGSAMEVTRPGVDSLRTLEELPPWQSTPPHATESTPPPIDEAEAPMKAEDAAPREAASAVFDSAAAETVAEAPSPPADEEAAAEATTTSPELELPSAAPNEAEELLAEAESSATQDWLGLSEDDEAEAATPSSAASLHPLEIKDATTAKPAGKSSSNGDGKRDSLANISVGLMGSERELRTDQVEQVFAEFRHRMADQLGNLAPEERYQLGVSYMEMGLVEEALEEFEPCLEHPTFGHQAREWMARCHLQLDRPGEVVRLLEQPLEAEPYPRKTSVELYYLLGQAYECLGNRDRALDAFNKVYQLDTEFRDVQSRLEKLTSPG